MTKNKDIDDIINTIKSALEMEELTGITSISFPEGTALKRAAEKTDLESVHKNVEGCQRCSLSRTRTNLVFGEGDPKARLMFVGEAPGQDEDEQGRPFVGRAGQLLTKIIESIGLKREEVYIANILKCRPPGNRNPLPEEIAMCRAYLEEQINAIKPEIICALGKFSAQTLLATEVPITRLRGSFQDYRGIKLMPTYHPAYLLRNSAGKKEVWEDMQKIAKELGLDIPKKKK